MRRLAVGGIAVALALTTAACNSGSAASSGASAASGGSSASSGASSGGKIALLLPESKTTRYEAFDKPLFEAKVKELCPDCQVLYSNAQQNENTQKSQLEAALAQGAKVVVLDPVNGASAGKLAEEAASKGVKVVSYDRLIQNAKVDYYLSYQNEKVGQLQAQALVDKLKADGKTSGKIVVINGSPTDPNAAQFKKGAHSVLDSSGFTLVPDFDTPDWSPDKAQSYMSSQIASLGKTGFVGVYAANDGTAGGAIAAMKAAGINPIPPTTGQDAELAAIQRILAGDQYMTVYKAFKPEAEKAAELAVALVKGTTPSGVNDKVNNGAADIPSVLLDPVAVTKDNVKKEIVDAGLYKASDICTAQYAAACKAAGIQ